MQIGTGPRKNLEATIKAMRDINARLLIIGKLTELQLSLLKENDVDFENKFDVSYEEIVNCYNRAKIVAFPTFYEGFGLPIIEANVMHKPVVSSELPIIREVGNNSVFYINPNDIVSIKNSFEELLFDKSTYNSFVSKGTENAKRFSPSTIYEQYRELYRSLENG